MPTGYASSISPPLNPLMTTSGGEKKIKPKQNRITQNIRKSWTDIENAALLEWLRQEGISTSFDSCSQQSNFNVSSACWVSRPVEFQISPGMETWQPVSVLTHSPSEKNLSSVRGDRNKIRWIITDTKKSESIHIYLTVSWSKYMWRYNKIVIQNL